MKNKVKPFFIRITDDMTPQMVQDAFDKCVDAGAVAANGCKGVMSKFHYKGNFDISCYGVFGIKRGFGTYIEVNSSYFDNGAQEITLDQLDEWLGLEVERGWKSGDECIIDREKYVYASKHPFRDGFSICVSCSNGLIYTPPTDRLEKPETPEQKAEREKKEAIDEIKGTIDFFADSYMSALSLYEQGYRKQ